MHRVKKIFLTLLLLNLIITVHALEKSSILFLISYDSSFPTFPKQYEGIYQGIQDIKTEVSLHIEFMDTKRFPYEDQKIRIYEALLFKKEKSGAFDYVICADDNALRFVLEYQETLFADSPVVFFGVNDTELALQQNNNPRISGFIEDISYRETLDSITKMIPQMEELIILSDGTTSGQADLQRIKVINTEYPELDFHYISLMDYSFTELYNKLKNLKKEQPLLLLSAYTDKYKQNISFEESILQLSQYCNAPMFHLWSHGVGEGLIGGKVVDHKYYAQLAISLIKELIRGADISTFEVNRVNNNIFIFDNRLLESFKIDKKNMPKGSVLLNEPEGLSSLARKIIVFLIILILVLSFIAVVISYLYRLKKKGELEIRKLNFELEKEKESLYVTLQSIGDGVIATDSEGYITFINKITEELTGWHQSEAIGRDLEEVFHIVIENTIEKCPNPALLAIEAGEIIELPNNTCLISREGKKYDIEDSAAPIRNSEGQTLGVIIVFRDTTEKKQLRLSAEKNQKLEALGVLAGGLAHDFNNYLSGVIGFVELAKHEIYNQDREPIDSYLSNVLEASEKAKSLTQQLLTFSKGGKPKKEIVDIRTTLIQSTTFALSGSTIAPQFDIENDLWNCIGDKNQISQCIDNLVINAIQAMPEGGDLQISAKNTKTNPMDADNFPYVYIQVSDTGKGISPELRDKIFDPFFTTKSKGHGLGLSTVFSIIQNHDGFIDFNSNTSGGMDFNIYLPATNAEIETQKTEANLPEKGEGTILVLDDQEYILKLFKSMLSKSGYQVKTVSNSTQTLDAIKSSLDSEGKSSISLTILDQTLPGDLPGHKVAEKIKLICPQMPLIAASGYADSPVMSSPAEYQFDGCLLKPFKMEQLIELISNILKT